MYSTMAVASTGTRLRSKFKQETRKENNQQRRRPNQRRDYANARMNKTPGFQSTMTTISARQSLKRLHGMNSGESV
jgi:hypothetical protein